MGALFAPLDRWLGGAGSTRSRQRVEQGLHLLQIGGVKAFGEPGITRRKEITSFMAPPLACPEFGECGGGSQFPELCLLLLGKCDSCSEALFCLARALIWQRKQHLSLEAKQFRFVPSLPRG